MKNLNHIVETLKCWRSAFLHGSDYLFERSLGVVEIRDYLENISQDGHKCYASFLFADLTDKEKEQISRQLDFYVNFDELFAVYDLEDLDEEEAV